MNTDIKNFIAGIREKTGFEFLVYQTDGESVLEDAQKIDPSNVDLENQAVYQNDQSTFFAFKFKGKDFIGKISGNGVAEKNYAYLISELAKSTAVKDLGLNKAEFCDSVLFGEANYAQIDRYMKKYGIKDSPVFVMIITTQPEVLKEVASLLNNFTAETSDFVTIVDDKKIAFVKFIGEESNDYHSTIDYAEFIQQSIYEETGAPIRISIGGSVKTFAELNYSYSQAISCAKMSEEMNSNEKVHTFKEFILIKILEDLPKHKLSEYLQLLTEVGENEIFKDREMVLTAEEFLDSSLNVSETARKLYLHRNTLIYRLDKLEKETGLNIRQFSDAITFRLITILSKLLS